MAARSVPTSSSVPAAIPSGRSVPVASRGPACPGRRLLLQAPAVGHTKVERATLRTVASYVIGATSLTPGSSRGSAGRSARRAATDGPARESAGAAKTRRSRRGPVRSPASRRDFRADARSRRSRAAPDRALPIPAACCRPVLRRRLERVDDGIPLTKMSAGSTFSRSRFRARRRGRRKMIRRDPAGYAPVSSLRETFPARRRAQTRLNVADRDSLINAASAAAVLVDVSPWTSTTSGLLLASTGSMPARRAS